jgi:hypothetical protein
MQKMEQIALEYFLGRLRFEHASGHQQYQITMPVQAFSLAS